MNNVYYCNNCIILNKCTDNDNTERAFEEDCNNERVLISFGGNTVFNGLPDYNAVEDLLVPPLNVLECLPIPPPIECNTNDDVSVRIKLNEDFS